MEHYPIQVIGLFVRTSSSVIKNTDEPDTIENKNDLNNSNIEVGIHQPAVQDALNKHSNQNITKVNDESPTVSDNDRDDEVLAENHKPVIGNDVLAEKTCRKQYSKIRNFRDMTLPCENKQTKTHKIVQSSDNDLKNIDGKMTNNRRKNQFNCEHCGL